MKTSPLSRVLNLYVGRKVTLTRPKHNYMISGILSRKKGILARYNWVVTTRYGRKVNSGEHLLKAVSISAKEKVIITLK